MQRWLYILCIHIISCKILQFRIRWWSRFTCPYRVIRKLQVQLIYPNRALRRFISIINALDIPWTPSFRLVFIFDIIDLMVISKFTSFTLADLTVPRPLPMPDEEFSTVPEILDAYSVFIHRIFQNQGHRKTRISWKLIS